MTKTKFINCFVLSFLALSFAKAQNIQFEDSLFKAALLYASPDNWIAKDVNGNAVAIDANGDGEISQAEALNIYQISFPMPLVNGVPQRPPHEFSSLTSGIISVKGIEYFTNLTQLALNSYVVKSLDLSKNINLQTLTLAGGDSLQTLDLSKNINLQTLTLEYNNSLKTLDLSKNINLQTLDLENTDSLQTVDLSKNTNLQTLNLVYNNSLQTLDVSKNINLKTLYLLDNNSLKILDLSKNGNLQTLNLEANDNLQTLDVSKNYNLQTIILSSGIRTLDVSYNRKLKTLLLACPQLTSLYMCNGVEKNFTDIVIGDGISFSDNRGYGFLNTSNLYSIYCDEDEIDAVKNYMDWEGATGGLGLDWQSSRLHVHTCSELASLNYSNVTDHSAILSWAPVDSATSYTLEYRKDDIAAAGQKNITTFADGWTTISGIPATTTSYTLSDLADNSTYEWRLTAVGSSDETPVPGPSFTTEVKSMGTEDLSPQAKATLYPNPVKDVLYFSTSGKVTQAEIYDLNGRLVKTAAVFNNSVNVSDLANGLYFIVLHTDKGVIKEKFIKN